MPRNEKRSITVPVSAVRLRSDALDELRCQGCGHDLSLYQPDTSSPEMLLGTCGGCGRWCMVEVDSLEGLAWVVTLPASVADRGDGRPPSTGIHAPLHPA